MAQWKGTDTNANSSVRWAVGGFKQEVTNTTANNFYANTTADAFMDGITVGQFGVTATQAQAAAAPEAGITHKPAHAGWVNVIEGSGGRAGRVQVETLVAMGSMTGSGSANTEIFPDFTLYFVEQPADQEITANTDTATFSVVVGSIPTANLDNVTYQWYESANNETWVSLSDGGIYDNTDTADLDIAPTNTDITGYFYRCEIGLSGAKNLFSSSAVLTVNEEE